ncbi:MULTISPECIES: type II secretion system F family protein [Paraburkholderia]|uniref:type II secretion system F family protein n=1 Tax=Paraburkholderia TaxID=1822464 RepID=UPI002252C80A|nr:MULTISPECIES: type II secretion system F family protein [Paraburkholderia]MCX4164444.1 type II secretion system F family protein [Paraburkholderia megapolitana]MDN7159937.1 type II secretion system F family protein [Paraburkholderia sp. CHISQ3]MDQ6496984.1 type II secretion system F family protein [Paraburkholderia megapolitana]
MDPLRLAALALALLSAALLIVAGIVIVRIAAERRSARTLAQAFDRRAAQAAANGGTAVSGGQKTARATGFRGTLEHLANAGIRWLDTPFGRQIVAEEDRRLLEQCGFVDTRTRGLFLMSRIAGAIALPTLVGLLAGAYVEGPRYMIYLAVALAVGFMLPKLLLRRRAAARRRTVVEELPMLVDLLRLLQGVGLSLDQSLQVMVNDFRGVLPVLSSELEIAQRQFSTGRTREQSFSRLASSYGNEDLRAIVRLLIQVDRHGGAVQEPLKQFGDRLRESRRAMLREQVGRLTVKMTGVMILTLLPALLIVTAGPGVLAVTHSLASTSR